VNALDLIDAAFDAVFDPARELPVEGIVVAGDPAVADCVARPPDVEVVLQHSPKLRCRTVSGAGHLIHDSRAHRHHVLDAILAVL
jgi:hypothetical protein